MYLSLPLPRALDRLLEVLLTLSTHDSVMMDLRTALTTRLDLVDRKLVLAEVTRHRVSKGAWGLHLAQVCLHPQQEELLHGAAQRGPGAGDEGQGGQWLVGGGVGQQYAVQLVQKQV